MSSKVLSRSKKLVTLFDFNPRALKRGDSPKVSTENCLVSTIEESWNMEHPRLVGVVQTCLPFRAFHQKRTLTWGNWYLDGDIIINDRV